MKKTLPLFACAVFLGASFHPFSLQACTGGAITAKDGSVVVGRTLEFGMPLDSKIAIWPSGSEFTGIGVNGPGLKFTSQFGFLGATVGDFLDQILDGVNEKGLNVGLFYFPGSAQYPPPAAETAAKALSPGQLGTWILANCASVADVRAKIGAVAVEPVVLEILKAVPDVHYKVQDASGACIVIEPVGGELKIHDNPVRVLTNSPEFPWHLTNLRTYLNATANYPANATMGGLTLSPFGMGGGGVGLPGDFTPPSRFVRMVFFLQNLPVQPDAPSAVSTLFHVLNNFDIPVGSAQPPAGTAEASPDFTTWTAVSQLKTPSFHWKTYGDQAVRVVDLAQALKAAGGKPMSVEMGPQTPDSVSPSLPYTVK
jgi:choloylglycine hydrolase